MHTRVLGFIIIISTVVALGWSLAAWSSEQNEDMQGYKKQTEEKMKTLDKKLDDLKAKAVEMKGAAKRELSQSITDLRKKQEEVKMKWAALEKTTTKKWEELKSEMSSAVQDMEDSYDKVVSRFKERKE